MWLLVSIRWHCSRMSEFFEESYLHEEPTDTEILGETERF